VQVKQWNAVDDSRRLNRLV